MADGLLAAYFGDDEARQRAAISRAYYAVLMSCRDYLIEQGESPPKTTEVHSWVAARIRSRISAEVAGELERLRHRRNAADYDTQWPFGNLGEAADDAVTYAREALDELANCS